MDKLPYPALVVLKNFRHKLQESKNLIIIILIYSFACLSHAKSIWYPGSFDPFHASHMEELEAALKLTTGTLTILPIEHAYYHDNLRQRPVRFFSYEQVIDILKENFLQNSRIAVSTELRVIDKTTFETFLEHFKTKQINDPWILIGPEVLHLWSALPAFNEFLDSVGLLVSLDNKKKNLSQLALKRYQGHPNIKFLPSTSKGIRSLNVNFELSMNAHSADLSPGTLRYVNQNPETVAAQGNTFLKNIEQELSKQADFILLKIFQKRWPQEIVDFLRADQDLWHYLLRNDLRQPSSWGTFIYLLTQKLPPDLLLKYGLTLSKDFNWLLEWTLLSQFYHENESIIANLGLLYSDDSFSQENSLPPSKWWTLDKVKFLNFYHRRVVPWTHLIKSKLINFNDFDQLNSTEASSSHKEEEKEATYVTVYRGVQNLAKINEYLEFWKKHGFISKHALDLHLDGVPVLEAITRSRSELQHIGIHTAVLTHVMGDWKRGTPLISASLDKNVAKTFAGKGGYVFTLRVPAQNAYFLNDQQYWQHTPWFKTGNPAAKAYEFAIDSHIPSEQIINIEQVRDYPKASLNFNLAWIAKNYLKALRLSLSLKGKKFRRGIKSKCEAWL